MPRLDHDEPQRWLVASDRMEETGHARLCWYCRWRARETGVVSAEVFDQQNDIVCLTGLLSLEQCPDGLEAHMPTSVIASSRFPYTGERITDTIWVSPESCEADVLAAWLAWWDTLLAPEAMVPAMLSGWE